MDYSVIRIIMAVIWGMSLLAFALFAWDKHQAVYGNRRTPEWLLYTVMIGGGVAGAAMAMMLFRHKTHKAGRSFVVTAWIMAILMVLAAVAIPNPF